MKNIILLLMPVLILCLYGGCGDSNNCAFLEYEENLANSECLAEDFNNMRLLRGCSGGIGCKGMDTFIFNFDTCTVIDCETIECENISFEGEPSSGFMSELELDIINGLPNGIFIVNETEIPFECLFFQP